MRDEEALTREQNGIWEQIAPFWDGHVEAHAAGVFPVTSLLEVAPGSRLLDIGCGNGRFSRHAHELGAKVVATDVSSVFVDIARAKSSPEIDYRVVDACDEDALLNLGEGRFD